MPRLTQKIQRAIDLMREFEPDNGYVLAFSGGKDSVVLYHLARLAGVKFHAVYMPIEVEPPENHIFIKQYFPDVVWHYPDRSFWEVMLKAKRLPDHRFRWCTTHFKLRPMRRLYKNRIRLVGERAEESKARASRPAVYHTANGISVRPLLWFTTDDIIAITEREGLPVNPAYGGDLRRRMSCVTCVFQRKATLLYSMDRWGDLFTDMAYMVVFYLYPYRADYLKAKGYLTATEYMSAYYLKLTPPRWARFKATHDLDADPVVLRVRQFIRRAQNGHQNPLEKPRFGNLQRL